MITLKGVKMQESVTSNIYKKFRKSDLKPVILTILFFLIIFFICGILIVSRRSNIYFVARKIYFVYIDKTKDQQLLIDKQDKIIKQGGAGVFVAKNNDYYLTTSAYLNLEDAKLVAKTISNQDIKASVVELTCKDINKNNQNLLKQNQAYFNLFKYLYSLLEKIENICFLFARGDLKESKLISDLVLSKLEIQNFQKQCSIEKIDELNELTVFADFVVKELDVMFNNFFKSTHKEAECYKLCVKYFVGYINFCNNF
jgi:hypothetical protein